LALRQTLRKRREERLLHLLPLLRPRLRAAEAAVAEAEH
jgi:hypothetical protein